jgi:poly(3-hydroxybutyrate) depolymerase
MRFASFVLFLASVPAAQAITSADFATRVVSGDGGSGFVLPYRIYVPAACSDRRCPLVVFLHGAGETGGNNTAQLGNRANGAFNIAEFAATAGQPVILAAPQAPEWWANEGPTGGVADMIDDIQREFGYDPARVYVTGLSMGGGGTIGFLQRYDAIAAAAAPICPAGAITSTIDRDRFAALPLWFFHAFNDGTVTVDNSINSIAALRTAGGDPLYTQYTSGDHGIWSQSYGNVRLTNWLLAQRWRMPMVGVDPLLALTQPTAAQVLYTNAASLSVAGSISGNSPAITAVDYSFGATSGSAVGTSSFTAGPLSIPAAAQTVLRVRGTGSSYVGGFGGNTTYSRSVRVVNPVPTNRAPRVALWVEPVSHVGRPLRLRALVDDDAQPNAIPNIVFEQVDGPSSDPIEIDAANPALAWWTPSEAGVYRFRVRANDGALQTDAGADVLVLAPAATRPTTLAVNAGGAALVDGNGVSFAADTGFTGGGTETLTGLTTIIGTEDDLLHRSMRRGAFSYAMPVANGRYLVALHLSEWRWFTVVARGMDVRIEGQPRLADFDLYRWAGLRQAMRMGFVVDVEDGVLNLQFARSAGATTDPRLDAFEILALPPGTDVFGDGFEG